MHKQSSGDGLFPYERRTMSIGEVLELIENALYKKEPLSISRFGHAEISLLNWPRQRKNLTEFVSSSREYLGATTPPEVLRNDLRQALKTATIVGLLSQDEHPLFAEETQYMLNQLEWEPQLVASPFFPHHAIRSKKMWELLRDFRVILVGRRAREARPYFEAHDSQIVSTLSLEGISEVEKTIRDLQQIKSTWDIALISASVPATVLCPRLAQRTGRVAVDFGHAMDIIIDSTSFDYDQLVANYYVHKAHKQRK